MSATIYNALCVMDTIIFNNIQDKQAKGMLKNKEIVGICESEKDQANNSYYLVRTMKGIYGYVPVNCILRNKYYFISLG